MATKYYICPNGTNLGSWSDTNNWSLSSGGARGAAIPTAADDVIFDANGVPASSGAIVQLLSAGGAITCNSITVTGVTNIVTIQLRKDVVATPTLTVTAGVTITPGAGGGLRFDSINSSCTTTVGGAVTHNGGDFSADYFTALSYSAPSNTVARTLSGGMKLTATTTGTHFSIVVGSGGHTSSATTVTFTGAIGNGITRTITNAGTGANLVNFVIDAGASGSITTFTTGTTVGGIDFNNSGVATTWATTNLTIGSGGLALNAGQPVTGTGTLTFNATSSIFTNGVTLANPIIINSSGIVTISAAVTTTGAVTLTAGTLSLVSRTLTCLNFLSSNSNTRTLSFGTGKIVLTNTAAATVWDTSTNTGLTVSGTPSVDITAAGTTTRTINTGALSEANSISFSILLTAAGTVAFTSGNTVRNLTVNTATGTLSNVAITIYGNVTTTSGTLAAGTNAWTFASTSGTDTLSSNGITWDFPIIFNSATGTWLLSSNITVGSTRVTTLTAGSLDFGSYDLTTGTFNSSGTGVRLLNSVSLYLTSTTATTTLLVLTTTTNLTVSGNPAFVGILGAGTQSRVISNGYSVNEATAWDYEINTTGGTTVLPTYTRSLTLRAGTITGTLNVYGDFDYIAGTLPTVNLLSTSASTRTISGGSIPANLVLNGVGGSWLPGGSSVTTLATNSVTLTAGNLMLLNRILVTGTFNSSNSNVRSIFFGSSGRIDLSSTTATTTLLNIATSTNLTVDGTPLIGIIGAGSQTRTISNVYSVNEATAWSYRVNTSGGTTVLPTYTNSLDLVSGTVSNSSLTLYGGLSYTAGSITSTAITFAATSGTWSLSGIDVPTDIIFNGSGIWQLAANFSTFDNNITLTAGTLDLNEFVLTTNIFSSSNSNTRTIDFGSAGRIDLYVETGSLDITPTNLTISGSPTVGLVVAALGGNNFTLTNGAATSESTAWNVRVDTASSGNITLPAYVKTLTLVNGIVANSTLNLYGGFIYSNGTVSASAVNLIATSGTWPISLNGFIRDIVFNGVGGTWQLIANSSLLQTEPTTLVNGTLDLNNFVLTTGTFASSNSNVRAINFGTTGRIDLSSATATTTLLDITTATNLSITGNPAIGVTGSGSQDRVITNGYSINEATAWDFRCNISGGSVTIPAFTRTLSLITGTIANSTLNLYGGFSYTAGSTTSSEINFVATSGTWPLSFNTLYKNLVFNGNGGTWQLSGACSLAPNRSATVSQGTLSLNGFVLTLPAIAMDGGTIAFGTSNIVVNGTSGTPVNITGGSATGTPVINVTYAGIAGGSRSLTCAVPIQINVTVGADAITLLTQVHSVAFTGTFTGSLSNAAVNITGSLTFKTGMTLTAGANAVSFTGSSGTQIITPAGLTFDFPIVVNTPDSTVQLAAALTMGNTRSMTLTAGTLNLNNFALSAGTFNSSNTNARTIAFGTTGSITLSAATATTIWDTSTATNFTTTGTTSVTAAATAGNKTIIAGGVIESSAINFTLLPAVTVTLSGNVKNLTMNNASLVVSLAGNLVVYGNFLVTALSSWSGNSNAISFDATTGTQTFTTAAKTLDSPIVVEGGSTVTLGGALTATSSLTLTSGTFNAATYSVTVASFASSNTNTRSLLLGTGTWSLTGTGTVWDVSTTTGLTFTKSTANIDLTSTSTSNRTFAGGGLTYNNLNIGGTTGISATTITGSNTFATIASTKTVAHTINFAAGTTTTYASWTITGTSGNVVTLASATPGSIYTLTKTAATAFQTNYMTISDGTATPSNTWYTSRSTDSGNNTGFVFAARPLYWIGGTGTWDGSTVGKWSYTSGGASAGIVPVSDCDVTFNANSDSAAIFTVTVATGATCRNMTVSGLQYTMTFAGTGQLTIYGSMTLPSTLFTRTYTGQIVFGTFSSTDSDTRTITLNGQTLASAINFGSGSASDTATWVLGGAFTTTATSGVTLTRGVLSLSSYTLTTPVFASSNSNTRSINFGTGKITLNSSLTTAITIWDFATITNFTVSGTPLVDIATSGASIKTVSTGNATESQSISFNVITSTSGNNTNFSGGNVVRNITCNSASGTTLSAGAGPFVVYGNLTFTSTVNTYTFTGVTIYFSATSGTQTITSNATIPCSIEIDGNSNKTVELGSNLTTSQRLTLTNGTFNAKNLNVTCSNFWSNNTNARSVVMGSGNWSLSGTGTVWDILDNNLTFNAGTSTIILTDTSPTARSFYGAGLAYYNLTIGGGSGSSTTTFFGDGNSFNSFGSTKTVAHRINFDQGSTTTFNSFTVTGTAGNIVTITAGDGATTRATLAKPTIWYVGANSIDAGNNTNLAFTGGNGIDYLSFQYINGDPPLPQSNNFLMFC